MEGAGLERRVSFGFNECMAKSSGPTKLYLFTGVFLLSAIGAGFLLRDLSRGERVFCQGRDLSQGQYLKVVFDTSGDARGTARLLTSKDPSQGWSLQAQDDMGLAKQDGNSTNLVMRLDDTTNIQVVKSCAPTPKCDLNKFKLPPAQAIKEEQDRVNKAEHLAFEYRKATSQMAASFNQARQEVVEAQKKLDALKASVKATKTEIAAAEQRFKETNSRAAELADKLQAMSAAAHDVNRHSQNIRSTASIGQVQAQTTELQPQMSEEWCR